MESIEVSYAGEGKNFQNLSAQDSRLVVTNLINSSFGQSNDYMELFIYGENGQLLQEDYDASDYYPSILNNPKNNTFSTLILDPEKDLKNRGFNRGNLNIQYNFYKKLFNSAYERYYWIKQISPSRTEIKLASQVISDSLINSGYQEFRNAASSVNYYPIFFLNFGENQLAMASNILYGEDEQGGYLLVKLYEPLPTQYGIKTELWIVDKIAESVSYDVSISVEAEEQKDLNSLRGPNFNVNLNTKNGQTTPYYNYDSLLLSPITSSFQKLNSFYQDKAIQINVDYSDFSNFVHFSSATERINNFVYKLQLIETSSAIISQQMALSGGGSAASSSITNEQRAINNIISNFDIYEYFLYFESSSWAWPKSNLTQPYSLYSVTSSKAANFLGSTETIPTDVTQSLLWSASYYDLTNKDLLHNSIPQYILDDPANQPYITFLDMIGQHFDNVWIYYKDVTKRFDATNNPNTGISLDLVSDALRGLGMQLYTNTNVSDNLYYTLFGINPDGSLLPPTGSELISKYVTSSLNTLPAEQIQDEIYKRIYHNIPYLYKSKGTPRAIKALISIYGIPDSMLTVKEFGGNFTGSLKGILDLDSSDYKVNIVTGSVANVTGSLTISSSLLSPYTTIQYYEGNTRLNDTDLQIGFSPADTINNNITASLTSLNIDQLIGSPSLQYSSSYQPLVSASDAYFSSYTQTNSVWEYIRLLKFYNNSLFKTIKDFVPARANVSTGIIVKSHILERNRYARHEPSVTFNDYSQSIEILEISADNGGALTGSTAWSRFVVTPLGLASYSSSQNQELYNGELDGTLIVATDGLAMEQGDYISHTTGSINFYNYGALYQNVSSSVKSQNLVDLDYTSDQLKPINYGAVTQSLNGLSTNAYATYTNPNNPFAQVQDYNYNLQRSLIPRYSGSATVSAIYNDYTPGDISYGKTAAIDKIKTQYAYIVDIYSSSFQMPYRAKGQIKYLIDNDQNILNLSKNNTNWFSVQNIFKTGEYADVSLFDYDPTNPYVNRLNNSNNDFTIWESGYSYTPLIYNPSGSLTYTLSTPELVTIPQTEAVYTTINSLNDDWWVFNNTRIENPGGIGNSIYLQITGSLFNAPPNSSTYSVTIRWYATFSSETYPQGAPTAYQTTTINAGTTTGTYRQRIYLGVTQGGTGYYDSWTNGSTAAVATIIQEQALTTLPTPGANFYTTSSVELDTKWWLINNNQVKISLSQSAYYGQFISTGNYDGLEAFVFPFSASKNDLIRFYNVSSSRWDQSGEFRISEIDTTYSDNTGSYILFTLDRDVSPEYTAAGSGYPSPIYKYIILKRLQDETSLYFNYNLPQPITQDGTLFPQYIGPGIKEGSGNVIKALKQQNLI